MASLHLACEAPRLAVGALIVTLALGAAGCLPPASISIREDPALAAQPFASYSAPPETPRPPSRKPPPPSAPSDKLPVAVAIDSGLSFHPGVLIELKDATTGETVADRASEDGYGAAGRLREVRRGRYLLTLRTSATGDLPLAQRSLDVPVDATVHLGVGWLRVEVPARREYDILRTIGMRLTQEPAARPIFDAPLASLVAPGRAGEDVLRHLLLPHGMYRWRLSDLRMVPTIGFLNVPAGRAPDIPHNTFTVGPTSPGFVLDLRPLIRLD